MSDDIMPAHDGARDGSWRGNLGMKRCTGVTAAARRFKTSTLSSKKERRSLHLKASNRPVSQ